jgi:PrtD family type I secretion system ABC transporter
MIDWRLGVFSIIGTLAVLTIAISAEVRTRKKETQSHITKSESHRFTQKVYANSEAVMSMGMTGEMMRRWTQIKKDGEANDLSASDISGGSTAMSKAFRMFLQSAILGVGAALAVQQIITPGAMIAGSIILGRALAPIQMIIGQWRSFIQTQNAYKDLNEFYQNLPAPVQKQQLPNPIGKLSVQNLSAGPPGAKKATLKGLNFELSPGDGLCVLGHSGSGKSSLARLLVGVWMPQIGSVRLDGATLDQWETETLGHHIGYLPQKVDLFEGTIGENISRFRANTSPDAVIRAAKVAGFHEFILSLPEGYNTQLGSGGVILSIGQIQRVALARALYGDPCLVVLDEPNSNLDAEGDKALNAAIQYMRHQNKTVIIVSHRPTAMAAVNKVLVLKGGLQEKFGLRDQVFKMGKQIQPGNQIQARQAMAREQRARQNAQAAYAGQEA